MSMLSSSIYSSSTQAKHSTAQRSAISPAQSSKPSTGRSERDNASRQTELARAINSMSSRILYSIIVEESCFSIFVFVDLFLCRCTTAVLVVCTSMLLLSNLSSTADTAQHSAITPAQSTNQARADQSATTQARRQSWREPVCRAVP